LNVERILIIRLSSIGDILLASPLLRVLRRRFPQATIDFVTKRQFVDLVRTNPHLNHIHTLDTRKGRAALAELKSTLRNKSYDLMVDIHNNFRSVYLRRLPNATVVKIRKYKFKRFLLVKLGWNVYKKITPVYQRYINTVAPFGVEDDGLGLEFFLDPDVAQQVLVDLQHRDFNPKCLTIAVAAGAGFATKRWPVEHYINVARHFVQHHNAQLLLLGDTNEMEISNQIAESLPDATMNLTGQYSLMQSACALNHAHLVLANDTGLMHLATALNKPTVAIFGPTTRELGVFPTRENVTVVEHPNLSCRPCTHIGRQTCPKGHFKCMRQIEPAQVVRAAEASISKSLLEKEL